MSERSSSEDSALELRRTFDASFALPPAALAAESEELLTLRAAGTAYAFRVREVSGVFLRVKVVPLPSQNGALLGLAGVRGAIVPVYGLGALLGHPPAPEAPRWLALSAGPVTIALAFEAFEGHLRLPIDELRAVGDEPLARHIRQVARTAQGPRALVDLPSILDALTGRTRSP